MYNIRMPRPSNVSYPRSEYYRKYYLNNKSRYRINYEDRKQRREELNKVYEEYGGEKAYYYNSLMKWLKEAKKEEINNDEEEIIKDINNINLN